MKIKSIKLEGFKRFTNLRIEKIPEKTKLVVMVGPNGCGKSSVFDALQKYKYSKGHLQMVASNSYYSKFDSSEKVIKDPEIEFHMSDCKTPEEWRKCVHLRSAYRNNLVDDISGAKQPPSLTEEHRFYRLTEEDRAISSNYNRLLNQLCELCSSSDQREKKVGDLQDEIFGELRKAIERLFSDSDLILYSLGNPAEGRIFEFNKGTSQGFSYQNLSSGEKASFDLLLDITVAKTEFNDTIFGIDEPEAHIHTKLQGPLLEELYKLIPDNSQLWIATHSIGMVRKAQDLWRDDPDSVVFLDFADQNFDETVPLTPIEPNSDFWARTYDVALGDLSELVAFEQYVFCEGEGFDVECYQSIFGNHHPEARFISIGGKSNVTNAVSKLKGNITKGTKVIGVVDRDRSTESEIERDIKKGICTLSKKSIESYLLDDEVLTKLCEHYNNPGETQNLLTEKSEILKKRTNEGKLKSPDDLKPIAQDIHVAAQNILKSDNLGNSKESFMMDILAKLIQPGMKVYKELHKDIFGE